jgi:hypothetical protein
MLGAAYVACSIAPLCSAALKRGGDLAWIDPAAIRFYKVSDSTARNLLYRGGVLAAGMLLLLLDAFPERWRNWVRAQEPAELEAGLLAAVAAWSFSLFLAGGLSAPLPGLALFLGLLLAIRLLSRQEPRALPMLARCLFVALSCGAAIAALIFAWHEATHLLICGLLLFLPSIEKRLGLRRIPRRFAASLVLILLLCAFWATIPPPVFRFPLDLSRLPPNLLTFYEEHLNVFALGPALRLGAHFDPSEVRPAYGWAVPLLMAALHRIAGCPIDIGTFLKISFALKYAFVCCGAIALYLYGRRRLLPALLFSLWVLSWNDSASPALEANHSAARFIGVPVFFLVLWSVRRRSFPFLLAVAAPALWLCALINPETALALFASALVYVWFRWRDDRAARLGRSLALLATVSPAALLYRGGMLPLFASGFGGTDFAASPVPFAVVLLALVVWADVAASLVARSPKNAYRAAAAAFLLIWSAYYVNRPWPSNLDISLYVFAFFALDIVRAAAFRAASFPRRAGFLMLIAVAAPLLTDALASSSRDLLWQFRRSTSIFHASRPDRVASGVIISADFAARLNAARAVWLKYSRPGDPCLVLSSHPVFLSEATCVSRLPFADPFQAITIKNELREVDAIRSSRGKELFLEPLEDLADEDRRDVYARLRAEISAGFRLRARPPHLEVWERREISIISNPAVGGNRPEHGSGGLKTCSAKASSSSIPSR